MKTIAVDNVNEAYPIALRLIDECGVHRVSRGEPYIELDEPVTTIYRRPMERVCLIPERGANPFFHLMEALWILAGRYDVTWLARFNKRMAEYSDDGETFHGAYGKRIRSSFGLDQIRETINLLKREPDTRRAVIGIWDPALDLNVDSKDLPCNTTVFFKLRRGRELDMTVCNRSNDVIWGAYGANVVQFSMLQEAIARSIGAHVGVYRQMSDSFHVYPNNPQWERLRKLPYSDFNPYKYEVSPLALAETEEEMNCWWLDLTTFMLLTQFTEVVDPIEFRTNWFRNVAVPMFNAWAIHKLTRSGLEVVEAISAEDWRAAAIQWLKERE